MPTKTISIHERIRLARNELKMTQTELADKIGVSKSFISDIENGRRPVSKKTIEKLNKVMGIFNKNNVPENVPFDVPLKNNNTLETNLKIALKDINQPTEDGTSKRRIYKQLQLKISQSKEDIREIEFLLERLRDFEYILSDLNEYYFNNPEKVMETYSKYQKNGFFDYDAFNDDVLQEYEKLLKFKPAIKKLVHSLFDFYKDIEQLDEHDISATLYGYSRKDNPFNKD